MQKICMRAFGALVLLVTIISTTWAQPQKIVADKVLAVLGNKVILQSDVINAIADMQRNGIAVPENANCLTLEQIMGLKALVMQAERDSLPVTDDEVNLEVENRIRYYANAYGGKEALEELAGKPIYQLKEDFKSQIREQKLGQAMRSKIVDKITVTPNEVRKFFDKIPKDSLPFYETEMEIGELIIYPKAVREADDYAVEQLNDLKKKAESGSDFRMLAKQNSDDPTAKENYGQMEINRSQKDIDPTFLAKAFVLKEGQISSPFKSRFGYHIIQMVSRLGDDAVVRHILKIPQVTDVEIKAAKETMDSVRSKLIAGTIDFNGAVTKYSNDDNSKFTNGMLMGADGTYVTFDQLDKDMLGMVKELRVGQYSQPISFNDPTGKRGVKIVYLKSQSEPHRENLKDDYSKIAGRALEEKKEQTLDNWFKKNMQNYYIRVDPEYVNCPAISKWLHK